MIRPVWLRLFALALSLATMASPAATLQGDAAHFFAYRPTPGQQAEFEQGYQRHLDWHRQHHDPLAWYGWSIEDGPRQGLFVDASVGERFAAFDQRVDPAGDGANFHETTAAYVTPVLRNSYVLLRGLSSGFPLEQRKPSALVQVVHYHLRPGTAAHFERALQAMRRSLAALPQAPAHSWYRLTVGGAAEYMLMVARDNWASYDRFNRDAADLLTDDPSALRDFTEAVRGADSETWRYRAELSYLP